MGNKIIWDKCRISINWQGVPDKSEDDIHFPPGYYMWNPHCVLNWRTGINEFDIAYIIPLTDDNKKDDGSPLKDASIYRHCPNGVVVRKHPSGWDYRPLEKLNGIFYLDVPNRLKIDWNEFHWIS